LSLAAVTGGLALAVWCGLALTGFWTARHTDETAPRSSPRLWPSVVAVVPARDEADVIARSIGSLLAQDYPGPLRIVLVDDNSSDGTGVLARGLADPSGRLAVLDGAPLADGWTGKLWAVHQGIAQAGEPAYLWLTDADIAHAPDTLTRLVEIAQGTATHPPRRLVSFMAELHCATWAEKAMIPAFVWLFQMLYPFGWINGTAAWQRRIAGAAGGCVLVERATLEAAGGIAAMRAALIDDCTLGALVKRQGPIWLGLTHRSRSIRPYGGAYGGLSQIGGMIARSAYAQLRYAPLLLAATVLGLVLMFGVPVFLAFSTPAPACWLGVGAFALMVALYQPMLRYYRRSPLWALALPLVGGFYTGCTLASAWAYYRGRGGMWKGRAQAAR
jgi:hopene-associated glycosyltransferase HpnB